MQAFRRTVQALRLAMADLALQEASIGEPNQVVGRR